MEDNNEVYQSLLPADGESLKGLKYKDSKKSKGFVADGYDAIAANLNAPRTQKLSNIVGATDYGNSSYDVQGESIPQVENLEDTRANAQPWIDKFGAGLGTFAAKTVTATAGGLGSLLYGVPKAIIDGEFNHIYNNDFNKKVNTGINNSIKYSQKYDIEWYTTPDNTKKDPSDFAREYGILEFKKLIESKI